MTIRVFLCSALLALSASAQTLVPARQVSASTNAWTKIAQTQATAQAAFDWVDANWMAVDPSAWVSLPTNANDAQAALDWIDGAWGAANTNAWFFMDPTSATFQATFDWLDGWFVSMGASNGFLKGTNVAGAVFNPTNGTWEGLGNMPGTNVAGATYNPTNKTWEGLGTMPGTNVFWATNANGTWTLLNMSSNLHACVVGAGAAGGSPVLTNGSSGAHIRLDDEIDQIVSDPGGWWDDGDDEMVLPVDGEYEFLFWAKAANCHVRPTATNDASEGYFQIGSGEWGTPVAGTAIGMWSVRQTFDAGTRFQFYVLPDATLNSTTRVDIVLYHVYLVGPKLDGAY